MIPAPVYEQSILDALSPVRPFLDNTAVTEIMINGPDRVYIESKGKLSLTQARFTERQLMRAVLAIAQFQGVHVDEHNPILEARLPDGSRVEAILPPAAGDGIHIAIRRFAKETLTVEKLIGFGSLTPEAAEALRVFVEGKRNVIVAGGTGSGKTSMLNALSSFIPDGDRVVVIEDARELQLQREHVVQLEAQKPDPRGRGKVTVRDLFRATLRMRPDRIVVGEIRGGEALDLIQAMTSGHGGCLSTCHATYPTDTMNRLETMALMSDVELPLTALRAQLASAIDLIVQTSRVRDGSRCVTHVTEVSGLDGDRYVLSDVFVRKPHGAGMGPLNATGYRPRCTDDLELAGLKLPASMFQARRGHA